MDKIVYKIKHEIFFYSSVWYFTKKKRNYEVKKKKNLALCFWQNVPETNLFFLWPYPENMSSNQSKGHCDQVWF